jgi:hypothetical protein
MQRRRAARRVDAVERVKERGQQRVGAAAQQHREHAGAARVHGHVHGREARVRAHVHVPGSVGVGAAAAGHAAQQQQHARRTEHMSGPATYMTSSAGTVAAAPRIHTAAARRRTWCLGGWGSARGPWRRRHQSGAA